MRKQLLLLIAATLALVFSPKAFAKGVIIYSNGEELTTIHKLPAEATFDDGSHANLGVHYKSFSIFWMPIWNYGDYKYALVNDAEDTWAELSNEEAQEIAKHFGIDLPEEPKLPLMTQIGLKPVILILIIFILYSALSPDKKEEETQESNASESTND